MVDISVLVEYTGHIQTTEIELGVVQSMTLLIIGWASLTLVFGLPTIKNLVIKCWGTITNQEYRQSTVGVILDRISLANLITFVVYMTYFN